MNILSLRKTIVICALLVCIGALGLAYSNEQSSQDNSLFIVTPSWKTFTEEDGSGFYFELMEMIYEPLGISIHYQITPWPRSVAMVSSKQADALLGSYKEQADQFHYPQHAIWYDISAAVCKSEKFEWQGLDSLSNKNVGWIKDYNYDDFINVPMKINNLIDNKQAWTLLELDRIDYYIDSLTDLKLYMKDNNLNPANYKIENVLSKYMYPRFAKTEKGKTYADMFDQRISELQKNGQLKKLYEKWGYPEYYSALIQQKIY